MHFGKIQLHLASSVLNYYFDKNGETKTKHSFKLNSALGDAKNFSFAFW